MVNPKSKAGYKLGIVNPLTLVGNEIRSILRERSLPVANVAMLDSSGASVGALTEMDDEPAAGSGYGRSAIISAAAQR